MVKTAIRLIGLGFWVCVPFAQADAVLQDFNRDGYKEGHVVYHDKQRVRAFVDSDADHVVDTVVYYKNGNRERAEKDTDGDGYVDTWIAYYFTGVPWKITEDTNHDGSPDYWLYLKNGKAYKWELDRNFDGKADVQTLMSGDFKIDRQLTDDDYDGFYEHMKGRVASAHLYPQSIAEALLR